MAHIQLALLAFDKGGNPKRYRDIKKEDMNPDKKSDWYPCLFDKDDKFVGPIYIKNHNGGKPMLLEAEELVRMKSYSWDLELVVAASPNRNISSKMVPMYLDGRGEGMPVPILNDKTLKDIKWT